MAIKTNILIWPSSFNNIYRKKKIRLVQQDSSQSEAFVAGKASRTGIKKKKTKQECKCFMFHEVGHWKTAKKIIQNSKYKTIL